MQKHLSRQLDSIIGGRTLDTSPTRVLRRARLQRWWPLAILLAAALISIAVWLISSVVDQSVRSLAKESITSSLRSNVTAIELWIQDRTAEAERLGRDDVVRSAGVELLTLDPETNQSDRDEAQAKLVKAIDARFSSADAVGWALVDQDNRVAAGSNPKLTGVQLPLPDQVSANLVTDRRGLYPPFRSRVAWSAQGPLSSPGCPIMAAATVIESGRRPVGKLLVILDPSDRFAELLRIGRQGESGETIAFDRSGVLISPSRFEPQLRAIGMMSSDVNQSSVLSVRLVAPDLVTSRVAIDGQYLKPVPRSGPLTKMADQATRGAYGQDIDGYISYHGKRVIGAWQWSPNLGIGFAHEVGVDEVYRPSRILRNAFWSLLVLIVALTIAVLGITWLYRRLAKRARRSERTVRRLGQYELGELLGCGGMGSVYRGRHHLLRRDVAVKVLEGDNLNQRNVSRFEREVQMTALLRHPNTIDIYDYGRTENGTFFYVMEYVDGITLQQLVEYYGPQPPERVIYLLLQICGSLAEAHNQGVIHRDVKPANLLLTARAGLFDMIKVLDFGLVKDMTDNSVQITRVESLTGTPLYVAPETIRSAAKSDHRSDIYSVGAVGYTLLTGRPTFDGETAVDICMKQLAGDPRRPSNRLGHDLPDDLQNLLMNCLRRDADQRPNTMEELLDSLRACQCAFDWSATDAQAWWDNVFEKPRGNHVDPKDRTLAGDAVKFPEDKTHGDTLS